MSEEDSTDRSFYDRQLRVLGKEAMKRMQQNEVVIVGLSGLGQEVAKNMILTGVKTVYLCDDSKVMWTDLSSSFYFTEHDVGSNRTEACIGQLKELNSYVRVEQVKRGDLTKEFLEKISVVCYTDDPILSLVDMNKLCRETKTRFVACETRGLFGCVFCDMGEEFLVFDDNGEPVAENTVIDITNEKQAMVSVLDENVNHGMGMGDKVIFSNVEGMTQLNEIGAVDIDIGKGTGKFSFRIDVDTTGFPPYQTGTGYCKQVKPPKKMEYLPLAESIEKADVENYDYGKWDYGKLQCHPLWRASFDFLKENKEYPRPYNAEDAAKLLEHVKKYNEEPNEEFVKLYSYTCRGNINPMAAMLGGFAAQEVQKAISGKFTPLKQWFYIDALECLNKETLPTEGDCKLENTRYDGNILVFGKPFQDKLLEQKIFVVGAGALGCEYLKNFALLGVGASPKGELRVTDMDSIEVSNLNRQFLFRNRHVGKMKSTCAAETVKGMNGKLNLVSMTDKVAPETEEVFNDEFWSGLDCVVNALDNIIARLYVDSKCLYYGKPLIEAGTLGPKANTQVVVPHVSESYGSQRDPPEKEYPQCTIKNFPYKIEHCISWARELFEGYFRNDPTNVNQYLKNPNYYTELREGNNSAAVLATLQGILKNLGEEKPESFQDCVSWARIKFEKHFANDIKQLLYNFPLGHMTKGGLPFWSGSKRPPIPLVFDELVPNMKEFIIATAMIRAEIYGLKGSENFDWNAALKKVNVPEFVPSKGIKIEADEEEGEGDDDEMVIDDGDDEGEIQDVLKKIPKPADLSGFELNVIAFEKDDDTNHHIDFITAASNSRAGNYKIPEADKHKTKGIAGKIIPAMVTSTAMITGFGCLEYLKTVAGKKDIESYRNAYVNLALPACTMSEPMPPKSLQYYDIKFTDWDHFDVDLGKDGTLEEFLEYFRTKHKLEVSTINYGRAMVFASYMPNPGEKERLFSELCFEVSQTQPRKGQTWINVVILADGLDDEEFDDVPDVKYKFRGY